MAQYVKINANGELEISGKIVNVANLVFKDLTTLRDIDGNDLLGNLGGLTTAEITAINDEITALTTLANSKADQTYVDTQLATVPTVNEVVLLSDLSTIQTPTPVITGPTGVNENSTGVFTISNYVNSNIYEIVTTLGTITNNNNGTFNLVADPVTVDIAGTIEVSTTEIGKLKSNPGVINVSVFNIASTLDQSLINASFVTNVYINDGYTL